MFIDDIYRYIYICRNYYPNERLYADGPVLSLSPAVVLNSDLMFIKVWKWIIVGFLSFVIGGNFNTYFEYPNLFSMHKLPTLGIPSKWTVYFVLGYFPVYFSLFLTINQFKRPYRIHYGFAWYLCIYIAVGLSAFNTLVCLISKFTSADENLLISSPTMRSSM